MVLRKRAVRTRFQDMAATLYGDQETDNKNVQDDAQEKLADAYGGMADRFYQSAALSTGGGGADTEDAGEDDAGNEQPADDKNRFSDQGRLGSELDKEIIPTRFKNLEHGDLPSVNAIVLHRTDTPAAKSVLNAYGAGQNKGAHFLVDTDGTIYQTADLTRSTFHVGNIRRKCEEDDSCPDEDHERLAKIDDDTKNIADKKKRFAQRLLRRTQMEYQNKQYPDRYPYNGDSVGIEVAGKSNINTQQYESPTKEQIAAVHKLVTALQKKYKLSDGDVYTHGVISFKQPTEGAGLGYD